MDFHEPERESFFKHCRKRRKCWLPAFPPFPTMFPTLLKTKFISFSPMNLATVLQMLSVQLFCHSLKS